MYSVLYVDDESGLLEVGKKFLEMMGEFSVDTVPSASEALVVLQAGYYDAVISDFQMPEMDGIQLLQEIRRTGNTIPFIIFTGRGREEIVIQALNEGADFYLQKGGDPTAQFAELAHKIRLAVRQREAVSDLEKSEERYRAVVEDQTELICRFTPDGHLTFVNDAYCRYFHLDKDRCLGRHHPVKMLPEDAQRVKSHLASLSPQNPVAFIEHRILMPDGSVRWQRWNDRAIFGRNGHVIEYQSVGRDNTELKQAEIALQESEEKYRTAIEKTSEAVIIAQDGIFVFANASMGRLLGMPPEMLAGKEFAGFIWPDDREQVEARYRQRIAGDDVPDAYDFRVTGAGGRMRWVTLSAARIQWQGRPATLNMLTDITERKQAETELEERQEKFFAAFTTNPDPLAITDTRDGTILEANPAFSQWSGYSPDELVGRTTKELDFWVDPHERDGVLSSLSSHEEVVDRAVRFRVRNGREGICLFSARFISMGEKKYLFTRAHDITGLKRAEEKLREREQMFRHILEYMQDAYIRTDEQGIISMVNPSAVRMFGYDSADDMVGRNSGILYLKPEDRDKLRRILREGGGVTNFTGDTVRKDGSTFPCSLNVQFLHDSRGRESGYEAIVRDLSADRERGCGSRVREAE